MGGRDVAYIGCRSTRYPGSLDIVLSWVEEALPGPRLVQISPYPRSRVGAAGFIGDSPATGTA